MSLKMRRVRSGQYLSHDGMYKIERSTYPGGQKWWRCYYLDEGYWLILASFYTFSGARSYLNLYLRIEPGNL